LLADENLPHEVVAALRRGGHDVAWVREQMPGSSDQRVLEKAQAEQRIILTFDKDFGELAFHRGLPATCGVILFRIPTRSPAQTTVLILKAIDERSDWAGHFSVVEADRIRMTPLRSSASDPSSTG
jgi:predicted nuclease of predicted toxin-antitoxin system